MGVRACVGFLIYMYVGVHAYVSICKFNISEYVYAYLYICVCVGTYIHIYVGVYVYHPFIYVIENEMYIYTDYAFISHIK